MKDRLKRNGQRVKPEQSLDQRLRVETLLSEIFARFVNLPPDRMDNEIQFAQRRICELLDIDRSTLWHVREGEPGVLLGETGTGKELLARAIHSLSLRKDRPLVTVNCAALPPTLIESELFGREKGAYRGAMTKMIGRFEIADGSTLFLDEIGELPLDLQSKLLLVLEMSTKKPEIRFDTIASSRGIEAIEKARSQVR